MEQQNNIHLNYQTVIGLLNQKEVWLNPKEVTEKQKQALLKLEAALEEVLPYLPKTPPSQPDELSLEKDIREEIKIAGANENG